MNAFTEQQLNAILDAKEQREDLAGKTSAEIGEALRAEGHPAFAGAGQPRARQPAARRGAEPAPAAHAPRRRPGPHPRAGRRRAAGGAARALARPGAAGDARAAPAVDAPRGGA